MRTVSLWVGVVGAVVGAAMLGPLAPGQTLPANYTSTALATGLSFPTCMALAPDGSVYVGQQGGVLRRWSSAGGLTTVTTFAVDSSGERGLIGVAVDPGFATNRFLYVHYTMPTPLVHNTVNRVTLNALGTAVVGGSEVTLLAIDNLSTATNHNGGAIHFGQDGKLYVAVGENANSSNSQTVANLKGKILRINPDPVSLIPTDNPTIFPGIAGSPAGNTRAIWAVGLRNPFTFTFQPGTGRMFINDVGQNTWEEINDGLAGRNYGWSLTEGTFVQASFPNFTLPLVWYQHTGGTSNGPGGPGGIGSFTGFAIVGGVFYTPFAGANANFPIAYSGDYFFGDEVSGFIRTFDPAASNGGAFGTSVSGVVDLLLAPDNTMLVLRGAGTGTGSMLRFTYTGTSGACCNPGTGVCALSNGLNCAGGSSFIWGTVLCSPNPCPQPTGACCAVDGTCSATTSAACTGVYQGNGSSCTPNPCPQPTGACCATDGTCSTTTAGACMGAYQGNNTLCTPNPCPPPTGACCAGSSCSVTTGAECIGVGTHFAGASTVCNVAGNNTTPCCKADFDQGGSIGLSDIFNFLASWFVSDPRADFNGTGGTTINDIFDFLAAWFAGC